LTTVGPPCAAGSCHGRRHQLFAHEPRGRADTASQGEKRNRGQPWECCERDQNAARQSQWFPTAKQLLAELFAEAFVGPGARDNQSTGDGDHQRGNDGDEAIPDCQHCVRFQCSAEVHAVLKDTDQEPGQDIDGGDENTRDGVALRKRDAPSIAP
jgi:hypothetical protein